MKSDLSNVVFVTNQLLHSIKVKVNLRTLSKKLESHPAYPSLLAISECLTEFKVDNQTYRIDKKNYRPSDLIFPFITHYSPAGGRFVLVHSISDGNVRVSDGKNNNKLVSEKEFLASWEGVAFFAEPNKDSGEKDYYQNKVYSVLQDINFPVFLAVILTGVYFIFKSNTLVWSDLLLGLLNFFGLGISILLLIQSINSNNSIIQSICRSGGKNDCNSLLKSPAAKITPWLSWSEVGFFYFSGSFLVMLFFPVLAPVLFWINILALPFTIYSLTYQYRNKIWCVLCCTVQALLIAEFTVFNFGHTSLNLNFILNPDLLISFFLCFIFPIATWGLLKPVFLEASTTKSLRRQLRIFKYNSDLFKLALTSQTHYKIDEELIPVVLGNPDAETVISVVNNPFCGHCRETHQFLDEWLRESDDFRLQLLFANDDSDNSHTKLARHFMSLSMSKDKKTVMNALNDWYGQSKKRYEVWAEKYPVIFKDEVKTASANQKKWCEMAEITHTPTIFINGYKLPESYKLEDVKYLI